MPDLAMRFGNDMLTLEGAMGTMLIAQGADPSQGLEFLNILEPEMVGGIHELYRIAGADCAISNTFGGTRARLTAHGLEDRLTELNQAGVVIAKKHNPEHVLGDVGPCGLNMGALGNATFAEVFEQYREQVEALVSAAPDAILIETMIDIADARAAVLAARSVTHLPVMVTCTFNKNGVMPLSGTTPEAAAVILAAAGADCVGMNCGMPSAPLYPLMQRMAAATSLPLIVQPNAGNPKKNFKGEVCYDGTADEAAMWAVRYRQLGVQMIGSCCGSTPAFTAAINAEMEHLPVVSRSVDSGVYLATPTARVRLEKGAPAEIAPFALGDYAQDAKDELEDDVLMEAVSSAPLLFQNIESPLLETALKVYPGRALVDISGDCTAEQRTGAFESAKRHGAVACLDAHGDERLLHMLSDEARIAGFDDGVDFVSAADLVLQS